MVKKRVGALDKVDADLSVSTHLNRVSQLTILGRVFSTRSAVIQSMRFNPQPTEDG